MLLQPHSEPVNSEVIGYHKGGRGWNIQAPTRWDKVVVEFHDIFDPSGMRVEKDTVHQIELLPNAKPHYRH